MSSVDDASRKARQLITDTPHLTLATADASGKPWSNPVYFAHDQAFTLYWVSFRKTVHSANIRARPEIAISILGEPPDHEGEGVYLDAVAAELHDPAEVERAIEVRNTRPQDRKFAVTAPGDVLSDAAWRIYRAVPVAAYIYHDAAKIVHGQHVDIRVKVTL
jgi:hypothetical protein